MAADLGGADRRTDQHPGRADGSGLSVPNLLVTLALVFLPLSLVTIGGGQTIVSDIHRQVVDVHQWMNSAQFVDDFAISRLAPGPGSLLVTLIGWQVAGLPGAVVATLAIFAPTAVLFYGVAHVWTKYKGAPWLQAVEAGLRPLAAGMILGAVYVLLQALDGGWPARVIAFASTACLLVSRINPILLLGGGAACVVAMHMTALI
jgi:chromate transporter